ncbi:hypothetical protein MMPV_001462 [Pyropia vietnamensis]
MAFVVDGLPLAAATTVAGAASPRWDNRRGFSYGSGSTARRRACCGRPPPPTAMADKAKRRHRRRAASHAKGEPHPSSAAADEQRTTGKDMTPAVAKVSSATSTPPVTRTAAGPRGDSEGPAAPSSGGGVRPRAARKTSPGELVGEVARLVGMFLVTLAVVGALMSVTSPKGGGSGEASDGGGRPPAGGVAPMERSAVDVKQTTV